MLDALYCFALMNGNEGIDRRPSEIVSFVLCFLGVLFIAAGIITTTVWAVVLGFLFGFAGLGYFLIRGWF